MWLFEILGLCMQSKIQAYIEYLKEDESSDEDEDMKRYVNIMLQ
jgi:hypothetical protein